MLPVFTQGMQGACLGEPQSRQHQIRGRSGYSL